MIRLLVDPFQLPFMQRALVEVLLLGLLGRGGRACTCVLRRLAFVGDALSHTVFPGVVVAASCWGAVAGASRARSSRGRLTAVLFTVLSAHRRVNEDAALAVLLTSFFAVGCGAGEPGSGAIRPTSSGLLFGRLL